MDSGTRCRHFTKSAALRIHPSSVQVHLSGDDGAETKVSFAIGQLKEYVVTGSTLKLAFAAAVGSSGIVARSPFKKIVKEIAQDFAADSSTRIGKEAFSALQWYIEDEMTKIFDLSNRTTMTLYKGSGTPTPRPEVLQLEARKMYAALTNTSDSSGLINPFEAPRERPASYKETATHRSKGDEKEKSGKKAKKTKKPAEKPAKKSEREGARRGNGGERQKRRWDAARGEDDRALRAQLRRLSVVATIVTHGNFVRTISAATGAHRCGAECDAVAVFNGE